ncbi:GNAT family N-acetyltransferase [Nocardia cyriacigeorgica]|uniref:GNAT family N-acetyltransferase n=1 Tax=Nocardia cyriacigeorgica TaxID=135487 RepID=UPI0032AF67EE
MTVESISSTRRQLTVRAVDWEHPDAVLLRAEMAAEVGPRYAELAKTLSTEPNAIDPTTVLTTLVAYAFGPVGHAALRWNAGELEVKRMFVRPAHRGSGVADLLLNAAEEAARAKGVPRVILQTGHLQPEAVRFYERSGYHRIPIFPPYHVLPLSNCFAKNLG